MLFSYVDSFTMVNADVFNVSYKLIIFHESLSLIVMSTHFLFHRYEALSLKLDKIRPSLRLE